MRLALTYRSLKNRTCGYLVIHKELSILLFISLLSIAGHGQMPLAKNSDGMGINELKNVHPYIFRGAATDTNAIAGNNSAQAGDNEAPPYDEVSITLHVQRIGSVDIPAIVYGHNVYLPVKDVFDFLKIKIDHTAEFDSVWGFFIQPAATYLVDHSRKRIIYQGKIYDLGTVSMIRTATNLFMRSEYFGSVFGLDCIFNFRSLSVSISTKIELPAIREMQQEFMRRNINFLKGEKKADTTIGPAFSLFHFGMADWSVTHTKDHKVENTRLDLALGAIVAGGEANLFLNYISGQKFTERKQFYSWKYVNNRNPVLRQLTAGKIHVQSTASVFSPVKGIHITNAPSSYRKSFGTYRLSSYTQPDWIVELYVNNVLVNYMRADASGFFSFDVQMVYGNSVVQLRFYGPWGEEGRREQNITIPFNFLPVRELEYSLTTGLVDNDQKERFARAVANYGLTRHITIGTGMEYLTSANAGRVMPFALASVRVVPGMLLSGEYTRDVRTRGILVYRLPAGLQIDLNYTKYERSQTAVKFNYLEEKKGTISIPFRSKKFSAFSKWTVSRFTTPDEKLTASEFLLSSVIAGISSNFTSYALFGRNENPIVYSSLSMSFRFPKGFRLTPQLQYEYRQKNFSMMKLEIEKRLANRGFLNLAYEKDMINNGRYITAGLRFNFSFAQTSFSARDTHTPTDGYNGISIMQSARGSLVYDDHLGKISADHQNNVGRGGLLFSAFLDMNCNGQREANEPRVAGLKLRTNGGRIVQSTKDSIVRVLGLEAWSNYHVELDKNSFDNIAWRIRAASMNITVEPNRFKLIEVPVEVMGEASGTVYLENEKGKNGLGRIIVNIYNSKLELVAKVLTEQDGYFTYMGLAPGSYTACIDPSQMKKLGMTCSGNLQFRINTNKDGDVADGLNFILNQHGNVR